MWTRRTAPDLIADWRFALIFDRLDGLGTLSSLFREFVDVGRQDIGRAQ